MSEPQAPTETAGNALRALQGQSLEVNAPFEQVGRLAEAIKNGGGGGGGYDDSELRRRIEALEKPTVFIAQYQSTTAQDIVSFLNNNPHAPVLVKNGDDIYTSIYSKILAENKVVLRTIASLQSKFNIFEYTVTNGSWTATTTQLYYDDTEIKALIAKNARNIDRIAEFLGIDLAYKYQPLAENEYVVLSGVKSIDTGLKLDGNAEIKATGYVATAGRQGVLAGAYKDNNSRTVFKFLSGSGKAQSCWAGLAEITAENMNGIDLNAPFSFIQNKTTATITQGGKSVTVSNKGYSGSEPDTAIFLFNQTENGEFNSVAIKIVEILIAGKQFRFEPMRKIAIENNTESVVILKDGEELPLNGGVLEIVEFQAA